MSMEATIYGALRGLVADRVYPDVAPKGAALPYITWQQIGGDAINFVDPAIPSLRNARVQVNVWADTRPQAAAMGRAVEDALRTLAALQTTVLGAPLATYDAATKLRGTMQDFSFWS